MESEMVQLMEMEATRRQRAAETVIDLHGIPAAEASPCMEHAAETILGADNWLVKRRQECAEFEAQFEERIAELRVVECPEHSGTFLELNREETLRASFETRRDSGEWKLIVRLHDCAECRRAVEEAETSVTLEGFGVPGDLRHCRLANWKARTAADVTALETVRKFARVPRGTLILISPDFGVGKSHLAVACMVGRKAGRFITQSQLLTELRAEYGQKGRPRLIERLRETPLLVIDELGLSVGGRDELPAIHEVLTGRYGDRLPTIITGNFSKAEELSEALGGRMFDRLRESIFATVRLAGASMRAERRGDYLSTSAGLDNQCPEE